MARVRRSLRLKRVGHGGTLDPAATGVLPIAIGKATRLLQYLRHDKAYRATVRFGMKTATDDLEGEVLTATPVPWLTLEKIEPLLPQFAGTIQQIPPSYSAIQIGGKRLYELARAGEAVEAPVRSVEVYQIKILDWRSGDFPELDLAIDCGPGTYIRSIARDLGDALNTGGTLAALTRTASSGFSLEDSLTLDDLEQQVKIGMFHPVPPDQALSHLTAVELPVDEARRWSQGQKIEYPDGDRPIQPGICQVHQTEGQFLGIGQLITAQPLLIPKLVWGTDS